ncbi:cytochrome P450 [Mycena floridula]|nr:cytochrome P450 [Mycena floridula]
MAYSLPTCRTHILSIMRKRWTFSDKECPQARFSVTWSQFYSPSWVRFQRQIAESRKVVERTVYQPYMDVGTMVKKGTAPPSLARDLITSENEDPKFQNRATWAVSAIYGAGTETTSGTVLTCILAMAIYPQFQKRAQEEIDNVVGPDRQPCGADMVQLPFTKALIKETLRFLNISLAIPRRTAEDDIYNGFFVPKDTIVFPNIWRAQVPHIYHVLTCFQGNFSRYR